MIFPTRSVPRTSLLRSVLVAGTALTLSSLAMSQVSAQSGEEPYRPAYHFSPAKNWMNDPNGMIRIGDEYHLYYQYNPFGIKPAHMSWGHAVSKDMLHWQELPVAIKEGKSGAIFSGSAVLDSANTSGFGTAGKPPLVAIYTVARPGNQSQNISYSNDDGRTFTPFKGNPVLDLGMAEFRDPMVLWHEPSKQWVMVVSMADLHKVRFYHSSDLKSWKLGGEFGPAGQTGVPNWECPNLFELQANGTKKWVLMLGIGAGGRSSGPAGGSATEYFVGDFDGTTFHNDNPPEKTLWLDYGSDFYAAQTWSGMPASDPRRIVIAWMSNWDYGTKVPTAPWKGQMSIPRELNLYRAQEGWRVRQEPVHELEALRSTHQTFSTVSVDAANKALSSKQFGETFELKLRFKASSGSDSGVLVRSNGSQGTKIGFDAKTSSLYVDRSNSGNISIAPAFGKRHVAPLTPLKGEIVLHVIVDRCSVEVFANDGETAMTDLIFPPEGAKLLQLFGEGSGPKQVTLDIWNLKSR